MVLYIIKYLAKQRKRCGAKLSGPKNYIYGSQLQLVYYSQLSQRPNWVLFYFMREVIFMFGYSKWYFIKKIQISLLIFLVLLLPGCGNNNVSKESIDSTEVKETDSVDSTSNIVTEEKTTEETTTEITEATTEEVIEPLDLTGLWIQEGKKDGETRMVADIREDGNIGVFFLIEGEDGPWTYWIGTYDAPTDDSDKYSWTSKNTSGGGGLLTSTAETKEFNYDSNKLSCEVSIDGENGTISWVRGDWDVSQVPDSVYGAVDTSEQEVKELEITESGWYVDNNYLMYYIVMHNPNDEIAVEYPGFRITARDSSNTVLGTEDQTLSIIYPGQDFFYGFQAFSVDETPTTVEFEIISPDDNNLKKASTLDEYSSLEVINTAEREGKFVGEIQNSNDYDIESAIVTCICKDAQGNLTYVNSTFIDDIKTGSSVPFEISHNKDIDISNVEYYANKW